MLILVTMCGLWNLRALLWDRFHRLDSLPARSTLAAQDLAILLLRIRLRDIVRALMGLYKDVHRRFIGGGGRLRVKCGGCTPWGCQAAGRNNRLDSHQAMWVGLNNKFLLKGVRNGRRYIPDMICISVKYIHTKQYMIFGILFSKKYPSVHYSDGPRAEGEWE